MIPPCPDGKTPNFPLIKSSSGRGLYRLLPARLRYHYPVRLHGRG